LRVAVLFSGGKDSTYSIWLLQHQGWDISVLLTVQPKRPDSSMFHYPAIESTSLQSKALGIDQVLIEEETSGLTELQSTLYRMKKDRGIEGLVAGAVSSDYQKTRFEHICETVGIRSYCPLWHKSAETIVHDLIETRFDAIITGVAARGLDRSWLGRHLDSRAWKELEQLSHRYGIHLTGEGGEYESFVLDAPNFKQRIRIEKTREVWDGQSGYITIENALLTDKICD
jgi:diphthine-ammonia ligase